MNKVKVNNTNKKLETLLTKLGFEKSIETGGGGYSMWEYETYYNPSIKCRVEYNTMSDLPTIWLYDGISSDIEDCIDFDRDDILTYDNKTLNELESCILNIKK